MIAEILDNTRALYRNLEAQQSFVPPASGSGWVTTASPFPSFTEWVEPKFMKVPSKVPSAELLAAIEKLQKSQEAKKQAKKPSPPSDAAKDPKDSG
jgi:hypothetical protein